MCFNESSVFISEDQELSTITLNLTIPLSTDVITTVITTDGTATGKSAIILCTAYNYIHSYIVGRDEPILLYVSLFFFLAILFPSL